MKVLMTADAVGGVWTYAVDLCRELDRSGVSVVLAIIGPAPTADQLAEIGEIGGVRIERHEARLEWMQEPWDDVERANLWLQDLADRESVDVVHLNGYAMAASGWKAPVVVVAHSCVCSWWSAVHGAAPDASWDEYRRRVTAGVRAAAHVVAPTRAFLDEVHRWYGPLPRASVIYNGRSPRLFEHRTAEQRDHIALACGRLWDESKNFRALDAAAEFSSWPVYALGERMSPDGREFTARRLQLRGRQSSAQVASWLQRASIYVHPAKYEPFGLSVLEAALAGCAIVAADLPSLRELWEGAACFANADDPLALAETIAALAANPALRRQMASAAQRRAREYSVERMGAGYRALYDELVQQRRQERAVA